MYPRHYFDLFRSNINEQMVFVGMSFAPRDLPRWDKIIKPAVVGSGLQPYRVDMGFISDSVLVDIMQGILDAKLLLFDISRDERGVRNGNVMYEIGLAHAMRHPEEVLIVRSDTDPLLFDVSSIRVHTYDLNKPDEAQRQITLIVKELAAGITSLKGIILDKIIGTLDEVCLGFLSGHANMPYFSLLDPKKAFELEVIAGRAAVRHLLDLGVLTMVWKKEQQRYAYTWTFLGKAVLQYLGFADGNSTDQEPDPSRQLYNYGTQRRDDKDR